jgi:hypothetical protein
VRGSVAAEDVVGCAERLAVPVEFAEGSEAGVVWAVALGALASAEELAGLLEPCELDDPPPDPARGSMYC